MTSKQLSHATYIRCMAVRTEWRKGWPQKVFCSVQRNSSPRLLPTGEQGSGQQEKALFDSNEPGRMWRNHDE